MRGAIKLNSEQYLLDKSNLKRIIEIQNHTIVLIIYSKLWREVWNILSSAQQKTLENRGDCREHLFWIFFLNIYKNRLGLEFQILKSGIISYIKYDSHIY